MKIFACLILFAATASASVINYDDQPSLIELAERLNLTSFVKAAKEAGVDRIINHEGKIIRISSNNSSSSSTTTVTAAVKLVAYQQSSN